MNDGWRTGVWNQFGAAIDMLEGAITACPEELWGDRSREPQFWYLVFHTLFWLDLYLTGEVEGFAPPAPFTLDELDAAGLMPDRVYSQDELQTYLAQCRRKGRKTLEELTDEAAKRKCIFGWGEASFGELLLYNLRHVQHGVGQLNLLLRREIDSAPRWVAKPGNRQDPA